MSNWKIHIDKAAAEKMNRHAEQDYPDECCGFMYGTYLDENERHVTEVRPVTNVKQGDKSDRFQIDPQDYQRAERYAMQQDMDLIGVYHSHPDHPAKPSEHDLKQALPVFSYVIISVKEGVADHARSWRLDDKKEFDEETIFENILKSKQKS